MFKELLEKLGLLTKSVDEVKAALAAPPQASADELKQLAEKLGLSEASNTELTAKVTHLEESLIGKESEIEALAAKVKQLEAEAVTAEQRAVEAVAAAGAEKPVAISKPTDSNEGLTPIERVAKAWEKQCAELMPRN